MLSHLCVVDDAWEKMRERERRKQAYQKCNKLNRQAQRVDDGKQKMPQPGESGERSCVVN